MFTMSNLGSWDYEHMYILSSWRNARKGNSGWKNRIHDDHSATKSPQDNSIASTAGASGTDTAAMSCKCMPSAHAGILPPLRDELVSTDTKGSEATSRPKHLTPSTHSSDNYSYDAYASSQPQWEYDPARDGFNHSLSDSQCEEAFPEYYHEIDRAAGFHKAQKITEDDLNITDRSGVVRAMIYDRQLYIIGSHMDNSPGVFDLYRAMAILGSLHRVIVAHQGPIPDIEFVISVGDTEWNPAPSWVLCRAPEDEVHWVMPDFGYWAWDNDVVGSYQQLIRELENKPSEFSEKKEVAFWRGADSNEERHNLLKAAEGQKWADIEGVTWGDPSKLVKMVDHCDYQYLVQTEGTYFLTLFPDHRTLSLRLLVRIKNLVYLPCDHVY